MPKILCSLVFIWLLILSDNRAWGENTSAAAEDAVHSQQEKKEHREMVLIDTVEYPVRPPWAGNKLTAPADTIANLQQIPTELTLKQTEIYLRNEAIEPLKAMAALAQKDNIELQVDSGYRSARYQRTIFRQLLAKGRSFENIARYVAPPGYSEHMLGTVVDFHPSNWSFARSATYRWLRQHAAEFGFSETYSRHNHKNQPWEPWHWKYTPPKVTAPARGWELTFNISNKKKRTAIRKDPSLAAARSMSLDIEKKPDLSLQPVTD